MRQTKQKMNVHYTMRMPVAMHNWLSSEAELKGMTIPQVVRLAILSYVEKVSKKGKP